MADVVAIRNEYREQTYTTIIQECIASGLRNKEFYEQRKVGRADAAEYPRPEEML